MRRNWIEVAVAGAVFVLGFLSLVAFYMVGTWESGPGLWHFRSATFGDGLLLPLAAGLLVYQGRRMDRGRRDSMVFVVCFLLGLAAAGLIVWQWLTDPDPDTNWTIPAPGSMNAAGIYHATFLIACTGPMSGLLGLVLFRMRQDPKRVASVVWTSIVSCLLSFGALLVVDDPNLGESGPGISVVAILATSVLWLVAVPLITRCGWNIALCTTSVALVGAFSVGALASRPYGSDLRAALILLVAVACATIVARGHALAPDLPSRWRWLLGMITLVALLAAGVVTASMPHFTPGQGFLWITSGVVVLWVLPRLASVIVGHDRIDNLA